MWEWLNNYNTGSAGAGSQAEWDNFDDASFDAIGNEGTDWNMGNMSANAFGPGGGSGIMDGMLAGSPNEGWEKYGFGNQPSQQSGMPSMGENVMRINPQPGDSINSLIASSAGLKQLSKQPEDPFEFNGNMDISSFLRNLGGY